MAVDDQPNATGRANIGAWNALRRRTLYRSGLTAVDASVNAITETIDLRTSRIAYSNAIYAFVQLLGGATSVTLELYEHVLDPTPKDGIPAAAGDDTDWALVDTTVAITQNRVIRFPVNTPDLSAGLYKLRVSAITPGGGSVRIIETHTEG